MLKNTFAVIDKIASDIENLVTTIRHAFYIILIFPPLLSVLSTKLLWVNVPLLILSVAHYIFFMCTYGKRDTATKKAIKEEKKVYSIIRNSIRLISLISSIVAVYLATETPNIFLIASAILTIISFLLSLTLELINAFIENRKQMLFDAIKMDFEAVTRPIENVVDKVTRIFDPNKEPKVNESKIKHREKIVELVAKRQEKIEKRKEEKRLAKEARKNKLQNHKFLLHK